MTTTDHYPPGTRVRVLLPSDPYDGELGRVHETYADCDEMVHVLDFPDGTRGHYLAANLLALNVVPPPRRPFRPASPPRPLVRSGPDADLDLPPAAAGNDPQED